MDILEAIARTQEAFMEAGIKPPEALQLESFEEGMKFLTALRQQGTWSAMYGDPSLGHEKNMPDGSTWMEIKVMGLTVRWPGRPWDRNKRIYVKTYAR